MLGRLVTDWLDVALTGWAPGAVDAGAGAGASSSTGSVPSTGSVSSIWSISARASAGNTNQEQVIGSAADSAKRKRG